MLFLERVVIGCKEPWEIKLPDKCLVEFYGGPTTGAEEDRIAAGNGGTELLGTMVSTAGS